MTRGVRLICLILLLILSAGANDGLCAALETSSGQPILIQTGAFKLAEGASTLAVELSEKGYVVHTIVGDDFHRVVVGPFADEKEAAATLSSLHRDGYAAYIRRDLRLQQPTHRKLDESELPSIAEPVIELSRLRLPSSRSVLAKSPIHYFSHWNDHPEVADLPEPPKVPVPPTSAAAIPTQSPAATISDLSQPQKKPAPDRDLGEEGHGASEQTQLETAEEHWEPEAPARFELPLPEKGRHEARPQPIRPPLKTLWASAPDLAPQPSATAAALLRLPPGAFSGMHVIPAPAAAVAPVSPELQLLVLAGDGAANNIEGGRSTHDPVVQVLDSEGRPVGDAVVTFSLPQRGASGSFANGSRILTVMTDEQGKAVGKGLTPNTVEGTVPIHVTASHKGRSTNRTITQTNFALQRRGGPSGAKIGIFSAIAAGAAVGIVKALEGRSPESPTIDPTIRGTATVGRPTVGAP